MLEGREGNDRLYGMAGLDVLDGRQGADHLEGGAGLDLYRFATGDGADTLLDSDRLGYLLRDQARLADKSRSSAIQLTSNDKNWRQAA